MVNENYVEFFESIKDALKLENEPLKVVKSVRFKQRSPVIFYKIERKPMKFLPYQRREYGQVERLGIQKGI